MTAQAEAHPGLWSPRHRTLTLGLVLTVTLVAFEALAVSTIMPEVARELGNFALYGWVFSAFLLAALLGIVLVGGLIDQGGLVRPFVGSLTLFSAGLVIGGLAPSMEVLVAGRILQGLGAGALPPIAYVAIGRALPEQLRAQMFATLSTAWVVPGLIGPALSGIVAQAFHWRFVFLGLLPLIVVAGAMTLPAMAKSVVSEGSPEQGSVAAAARRRFPWAVLVTVGAGLIVAGLTAANLVPGVPLFVAGVALAVPAFRHLTPPGTLRAARGLPAAVLLRGALTFAFYCASAYVPLALVDWRGLDLATAGIALTAATLAWTGGAWIQARQFSRIGARRLVTVGFLTVAVGILGFTTVLIPSVPVVVGMATWGIAGLGMGLAYSPISLTVLAHALPGGQGAATSGMQLSDVLGSALGIGAGGAIVAGAAAARLDGWVGLGAAFAIGVAAALGGAALAHRLPGPRERPAGPAAVDFTGS